MYAHDQVMSDLPSDTRNIVMDYAKSIPSQNMPAAELRVKVNAIYTIMRTFNRTRKLMNGTVVRVVAVSSRLITVWNYTTGEFDDIPRISFVHEINRRTPVKILRRQFPLRPRYAITANLCQGKTIWRLLLDLRVDPFAHGQLHVALSRAPSSRNIRVLTMKTRIFERRARTVNVVHHCLLQDKSSSDYVREHDVGEADFFKDLCDLEVILSDDATEHGDLNE